MSTAASDAGESSVAPARVPRPADLDPLDRELVEIVLNEPSAVATLITRVEPSALRDESLRAILRACYDLHGEGQAPRFERVADRLEDPAIRSLAAALLLPIESGPLPERLRPAPWPERLARLVPRLDERDRLSRLRALQGALAELDPAADPAGREALWREQLQLLGRRPAARG